MADQLATSTPETKPAVPPGVFAEIAKRHEEIRADKSLELWIPGYEGMIKVRYRLLHDEEMDKLVQRAGEVKPTEGIAGDRKISADTLVRMCDRILYRDDENDRELKDEKGPIRFERRFADFMQGLGIQVGGEKATEIVENFFSPRTDPDDPTSVRSYPNAMGRHFTAILQWYQGERDKIDRELLGN